MTIALSLTIRLQCVIECLRRSNQQGIGHFGTGCSPWNRSVMLAPAESEHSRLASCEIIFEDFQPIARYLNVTTDGQTDRETDRRLTASLHHAVIIVDSVFVQIEHNFEFIIFGLSRRLAHSGHR